MHTSLPCPAGDRPGHHRQVHREEEGRREGGHLRQRDHPGDCGRDQDAGARRPQRRRPACCAVSLGRSCRSGAPAPQRVCRRSDVPACSVRWPTARLAGATSSPGPTMLTARGWAPPPSPAPSPCRPAASLRRRTSPCPRSRAWAPTTPPVSAAVVCRVAAPASCPRSTPECPFVGAAARAAQLGLVMLAMPLQRAHHDTLASGGGARRPRLLAASFTTPSLRLLPSLPCSQDAPRGDRLLQGGGSEGHRRQLSSHISSHVRRAASPLAPHPCQLAERTLFHRSVAGPGGAGTGRTQPQLSIFSRGVPRRPAARASRPASLSSPPSLAPLLPLCASMSAPWAPYPWVAVTAHFAWEADCMQGRWLMRVERNRAMPARVLRAQVLGGWQPASRWPCLTTSAALCCKFPLCCKLHDCLHKCMNLR